GARRGGDFWRGLHFSSLQGRIRLHRTGRISPFPAARSLRREGGREGMSEVSIHTGKWSTKRGIVQAGGLLVLTAAMTVVAPLLLPTTAYYLNLFMQASTYAV